MAKEKGKDPAFLFYPNDWHTGTMTMGRYTKGCYIDLLTAQFNSGHLSISEIKIVLGQDYGTQWPLLLKKFKTDADGFYYNERMDKEISRRKEFSKKQSERVSSRYTTESLPDDYQKGTRNEDYLIPKDFLIEKYAFRLDELHMKSKLEKTEFEDCITQWSLKVIEQGWEYSEDVGKDLQRLAAGFEKWLNSWVKNLKNKQETKNVKPQTTPKIGRITTDKLKDYLQRRGPNTAEDTSNKGAA